MTSMAAFMSAAQGAGPADLSQGLDHQHSGAATKSVPFPTEDDPLPAAKGKRRLVDKPLPSSHNASVSSSRQRTTSDHLLDGLLCAHPSRYEQINADSEASGALTSPSEGSRSPIAPLHLQRGLEISGGQTSSRNHRRQSSLALSHHTGGNSSLGTISDFDYFGSSSLASTAPTSLQSMSPVCSKLDLDAFKPQQGLLWGINRQEGVPQTANKESEPIAGHTISEQASEPSRLSKASTIVAADGTAVSRSATQVEEARNATSAAHTLHVGYAPYSRPSSPVAMYGRQRDASGLSARPSTSDSGRFRRAMTFGRSDSAPNLFRMALPKTEFVTPSRPGRPTGECSTSQYAADVRLRAMAGHRMSTASQSHDMVRAVRNSLTERPAFLKPAFWRTGSLPGGSIANSPTAQSRPSSPNQRRPSTPSSLRFGRTKQSTATPSSSRGSSPKRFSKAAKSLFTRRDGREIVGIASLPSSSAALETLQRAQDGPFPAIGPALFSHRVQSRRPTLLRAALSSSPSASTAVTPFAFASAEPANEGLVDLFSSILPREIQIRIFSTLLDVYVSDYEDRVIEGKYRGREARDARYVGLAAGLKQIIRISRVCKSWNSLSYDGQLWTDLNSLTLPELTATGLLGIAKAAGLFLRSLEVTGLTTLSAPLLKVLVHHTTGMRDSGVTNKQLSSPLMTNNLTHISLQGSKHVDTASLHFLLSRSPLLESATLSSLAALSNDTCIELANSCPQLQFLDVSRCGALDGEGLDYLKHLKRLRVIKATGVKQLDASIFANLARSLDRLQTLDLSYSDLNDGCLAAITAHDGPEQSAHVADMRSYFELTASQSGSRGSQRHYRAVMPSLRHLALSSSFVTDRGLATLAHGAVPNLEILEVAHNRGIHDGGLIALLQSSPYIRRLDFEGLTEITNKTLKALNPLDEGEGRPSRPRSSNEVPSPGSRLTHLLLSQCRRIDTAAMLALVTACPGLHHLEVDDTNATDSFAIRCLKEMMATSRKHRLAEAAIQRSYCLSLIDCRSLTRSGCNAILATNVVRPRLGRRGYSFNPFHYGDSDRSSDPLYTEASLHSTSTVEQTAKMLEDECNVDRICVKTFWFWQAIDAKERKIRKKGERRDKGKRASSGGGSSLPVYASNDTENAVGGLSRVLLGGGGGGGGGAGSHSAPSSIARDGRNGTATHAQEERPMAGGIALQENRPRPRERGNLARWTRVASGLFTTTTPSEQEEEESGSSEAEDEDPGAEDDHHHHHDSDEEDDDQEDDHEGGTRRDRGSCIVT